MKMNRDIAIFTEAIAKELIARGYELVTRTSKAWYFEDSAELRITLEELLENYEE